MLVIDDRDEFRSVVDRIAEYVGRPISRVRLWRPPIASVRGLIMFAAGWSPQALPLRLALFRARDEDGALVSRFVLSLSPLLERHGVSYKTPPWGGYLFWVLTIVFVILAPAVIGDTLSIERGEDCSGAAWTTQQFRDAFPWHEAPRYLLRDRDHAFDHVKTIGIRLDLHGGYVAGYRSECRIAIVHQVRRAFVIGEGVARVFGRDTPNVVPLAAAALIPRPTLARLLQLGEDRSV